MEEKELALLNAVKTTVAKYGISGISTRNIGDIANVNDAYIYRFFVNKEDLLLEAYKHENGIIFDSLLHEMDKVHQLPVSFAERARKWFDNVWQDLLSDYERLNYCVCFYHSSYFKAAEQYHQQQMIELYNRIGTFFPNKAQFEHAMYTMCSILYDSAYSITTGRAQNTPEYAERVFKSEYAVLFSML